MVKQPTKPTRKAQNFRIADFMAAFRELHRETSIQVQAIRNIANQNGGDTVELSKKKLWALIGCLDRMGVGADMLNEALGGLPDDPEAEDIVKAIIQDTGVPLEAYKHVREGALYWRDQAHAYREKYRIAKKNAEELAEALCHNSDQEADMLKFFFELKTKSNDRG